MAKGPLFLKARWDDERKRLEFPWLGEFRGRVVHLHFAVTPEDRQMCEATHAAGLSVEGFINHGALRVVVSRCPVPVFCRWPKSNSHRLVMPKKKRRALAAKGGNP